jgi:hypothetical protein
VTLAEKLNQMTPSSPGLPCGISLVLNVLTGEDKKALEVVMGSPSIKGSISNRQIHKLLLSEGYEIAFSSIRLHRSKQCRCYTGKLTLAETKKQNDRK